MKKKLQKLKPRKLPRDPPLHPEIHRLDRFNLKWTLCGRKAIKRLYPKGTTKKPCYLPQTGLFGPNDSVHIGLLHIHKKWWILLKFHSEQTLKSEFTSDTLGEIWPSLSVFVLCYDFIFYYNFRCNICTMIMAKYRWQYWVVYFFGSSLLMSGMSGVRFSILVQLQTRNDNKSDCSFSKDSALKVKVKVMLWSQKRILVSHLALIWSKEPLFATTFNTLHRSHVNLTYS